MKNLYISAINITYGGPLTILEECLISASKVMPKNWKIYVFLSPSISFKISRIKCIHINHNLKNKWMLRLYYEFFYFYKFSLDNKIDLWISLQDFTSLVKARRQIVYFHNPAVLCSKFNFFKFIKLEPRFVLFFYFFIHCYKFIVSRNYCIIVQQCIMRNFLIASGISIPIFVSPPLLKDLIIPKKSAVKENTNQLVTFLFPLFPRVFKNVEILCEAVKILHKKNIFNFELILTISPDDNKYSKFLFKEYGDLPKIRFEGTKTRKDLYKLYKSASYVVFPSKLETWGLPIREAKLFNKKLILVDLPYARETLGNYDKVCFFKQDSPFQLSNLMQKAIDGSLKCSSNFAPKYNKSFFMPGWKPILKLLIKDL